jgi:hypothetical protein
MTIESERVSITRWSSSLPRNWCQSCGALVGATSGAIVESRDPRPHNHLPCCPCGRHALGDIGLAA